ncbi:uncharacterized protein LOC142841487 isoform X2 [Microtus pennsylvanicus]
MPCGRSLPARLLLLLLLLLPEAEVAEQEVAEQEVAEQEVPGQEVPPCPARCACYAPGEVHCTFRSLTSFPAGVWRGVERVNLGYNGMTSLPASALAGLSRLRLLLLHGNEIEEIQDGALRDLGALQVLKLSYNRLRTLTSGSLRGARALTRLHLDHNRLTSLGADALLGLTSLRLLTLEGNALASLPPGGLATFDLLAGHSRGRGRGRSPLRVSTLRHLSLADNALTSLPPALLPAAPLLETLALHGNPWACDCARAGWVGAWTAGVRAALRCRKDKDAALGGTSCPVCASPAHFRGRDLRDLGADDVTCAAPVLLSPLRKNETRREPLAEVDDDDVIGGGGDDIALGGPGDDVIGVDLADAHGTRVTLACDPRAAGPPQVTVAASKPEAEGAGLGFEAAVTLDVACAVTQDGGYERAWRLLAYYGEVSAALAAAGGDDVTARYAQDPDDADALYYTGLRVNLTTPPEWAWLRAPHRIRLRLDRRRTTARRVLMTYEARLSRALPGDGDANDITDGDDDVAAAPWVAIAADPDEGGGIIAREGERVRIPCNVTASATASVAWRLPGGAVVTGTVTAAALDDDVPVQRRRGSRIDDTKASEAAPGAWHLRPGPRSPRSDAGVQSDGSLVLSTAPNDDVTSQRHRGSRAYYAVVSEAAPGAWHRLQGPRSPRSDVKVVRDRSMLFIAAPDDDVSTQQHRGSRAYDAVASEAAPGAWQPRRGPRSPRSDVTVLRDGSLVLAAARVDDAGRYLCVASVGAAQTRAARRLVVTPRSGPSRADDAVTLRATPGAALLLPCAVAGANAAAAAVAWELPGGRLLRRGENASSGGAAIAAVDGNGSLALTPRRGGDSGHFRCVAVNQAGSDAFAVEIVFDAGVAARADDVTGGDGAAEEEASGAEVRAAGAGSRKLAGTKRKQNRNSAPRRGKQQTPPPPPQEVTSPGPPLSPSPGRPRTLVVPIPEGRRGRRVHVTNAPASGRDGNDVAEEATPTPVEATPTPSDLPSPAPMVAAETDAFDLVTDATDVIGDNDVTDDVTDARDDVIGVKPSDVADDAEVAGFGCVHNVSYDVINCADAGNVTYDVINATGVSAPNVSAANVSAPSAEEEEAETEEEAESVEAPPLKFPVLYDVIQAPPPAPALRFQPGSNSGSSEGGDFRLWPASSASGSSEQRQRGGGGFRFRPVGAFPPLRIRKGRRKRPWGFPRPTTSDPSDAPMSGSGTSQATPTGGDVTVVPRGHRRGRKRVRNRGRQAPPPTPGPARLELPVPEAPPPEVTRSPRRKSGRRRPTLTPVGSSGELEVVTPEGGLSASSPVRQAWSVTSLPVTSPTPGSVTTDVTETATYDLIGGTEDDVTVFTGISTDDVTTHTDDVTHSLAYDDVVGTDDDLTAQVTTDDVTAFADDITARTDDVTEATAVHTMPDFGSDDVIRAFATFDPVADLAPGTLTAFPEDTTGDVTGSTHDVTGSAHNDVIGDVVVNSMDDVVAGPGDVIARPARPLPDALSASGSAEAPPPPPALPALAPPPALEAGNSQSEEETAAMTSPPLPLRQEVAVTMATVTPPPLPAVPVTSSHQRPLPVRQEVAEFPPPPPQAPPSFRFSLPRAAGVTPRSTPPLPPAPGIPVAPPFRPVRIHAHLGPPAPPASRSLSRVMSRDPAMAASMTSSATSPEKKPLVLVPRGSRLRLRCEAVGFPAPRVLWRLPSSRTLLGRVAASPDPRVSVAPDGSLLVAPVSDRDAGDYACLAGDASAAFTVHVLAGAAGPAPSGVVASGSYRVAVRPAVTPDPPWRLDSAAAAATVPVISARVGSSVRVACRGAARTASPVTWQLPDGARVTSSFAPVMSSPRARVDPHGWLTVWPLAPGDAGIYRCWAPGAGGGVASRAVYVRVA